MISNLFLNDPSKNLSGEFQNLLIQDTPVRQDATAAIAARAFRDLQQQETPLQQIQTKPNGLPVLESQWFLNKITQKNMSMANSPTMMDWTHIFNILKKEFGDGIRSYVRPDDCKLSNPFAECQQNGEVFFLPSSSLENADSPFHNSVQVTNPAELKFLKETLQAAFTIGKKIVVVRLSNDFHAVAASFSAKGKFQIIDSMSSSIIDIEDLTMHLNQAEITNSKGKPIQFEGEYINTHLQKGGHECIRFATLYCYQIFKRGKMEAFEEVNGAFAEGKLKKYEDYKNIDGSKKLRSFENHERSLYIDFMRSWAFRTLGLELNNWKDISIQMLNDRPHEFFGSIEVWFIKKDPHSLPHFQPLPSKLIFLNFASDAKLEDDPYEKIEANSFDTMPREQEIPIQGDKLSCTLGSLASPDETRMLVFEKGVPLPRLYRSLPDQCLEYINHSGEQVYIPYS